MTSEERDALAALVTRPFVTAQDTIRGSQKSVISVIVQDDAAGQRIRRDLDNLGRELVIEEQLGLAWARQRDEVDLVDVRRTARRRTIAEDAKNGMLNRDILFMALKLRNCMDDSLARNVATPRLSTKELFDMFSTSPSAERLAGDAMRTQKAFERCLEACKNTTSGIGLIEKDPAIDSYLVLPTVLVLVTDDFADAIADAKVSSNENEPTDDAENDATTTDDTEADL